MTGRRYLISILALPVIVFSSCSEDRSPSNYQTHAQVWGEPASPGFHGPAAVQSENQGCAGCHGADFRGGTSGVACHQCHDYPHAGMSADTLVHQELVASLNWDLAHCTRCHGQDFAGGRTGSSCNACHSGELALTGCTACHGLPPVDSGHLPYGMAENAYGAHAAHARYECTECHASVGDLSHASALPADVSFEQAQLARLEEFSDPEYEHRGVPGSGNGTCAANYCHSDGNERPGQDTLEWVGGEATCTSCHLIPPPPPHTTLTVCYVCHGNVDPSSQYPDDIRFVDDSTHVDGRVQLGG